MNKAQHIMIDLETLGTRPGSIVLTVGAVKFSKEGLGETFYCAINEGDSRFFDLTSDPSTLLWWRKQSAEAREAAFSGKTPLPDALELFAAFCNKDAPLGIAIWGNGSDFDNVLLEAAYEAVSMEKPWKFFGNRCYRTVKNLFPDVWVDPVGTAHNALDDATYQANHLIAISNLHGFDLA